MKQIDTKELQNQLQAFVNDTVYVHLETTNGAYAAHHNEGFLSAGVFLRNGRIQVERATIKGDGPYRIGIKLPEGWLYAEGLTHFEKTPTQLLIAGLNAEGRLAVALQLSRQPFGDQNKGVDAND
ncbi:YojF family protein [Aureibacillus halotolerans]|uniref:Uncharacterized protein DUF1806 n=1 Tax=Aureibacillus halotolerans TaxID=1508390 RepID=A0A4R6U4Q3_9BACI|nr:YojF family protein [Aureibacillus halotolerans]TDQ39773.1 uncharacterized protein DUF1806 [Aureibacillus halotolerans]